MRSLDDAKYEEINTAADAKRVIKEVLDHKGSTIDEKWICIGGLYRFYTESMSSADRKQANLAIENAQGKLMREKEGA